MFRIIRLAIWIAIIIVVVGYIIGGENPIRKSRNKKISGVCAGIAEALKVDPTVVRLAWILFIVYGGSGILAYIIAAIIMPEPYK